MLPGAHRNYGLGHSFLRHIERCSLLIFVLNIREREISNDCTQLQEEGGGERRRIEEASSIVGRNDSTGDVVSGPSSLSLVSKGKLNPNEVLPLTTQYQVLQEELELHKEGLVDKVKLIVINKVDLEGGEESVLQFINDTPGLKLPVVPVSGMKEWNIQELKEKLYTLYNDNNR